MQSIIYKDTMDNFTKYIKYGIICQQKGDVKTMFKNLSKKSSKNIEKFEENNNYNEPEIIETFTDEELVEYKHKNKIYKISKKIINISFIPASINTDIG